MSDPACANLTFEQALEELERIVRVLEDGQTSLEDALTRYEAGVGLLKRCYAQLSEAEQRILQVTGVDESGKPLTQPFRHSATGDGEAARPTPPPATEPKPRPRKEAPQELF
jgi:exodeoxyribonuclease VII small subunit